MKKDRFVTFLVVQPHLVEKIKLGERIITKEHLGIAEDGTIAIITEGGVPSYRDIETAHITFKLGFVSYEINDYEKAVNDPDHEATPVLPDDFPMEKLTKIINMPEKYHAQN